MEKAGCLRRSFGRPWRRRLRCCTPPNPDHQLSHQVLAGGFLTFQSCVGWGGRTCLGFELVPADGAGIALAQPREDARLAVDVRARQLQHCKDTDTTAVSWQLAATETAQTSGKG